MPELLQKTLLISKSKLPSWIMHLGQAQERSAGDACVQNISIANITRHFFSSEKEFTSDPGSSRSRFTFAARRDPIPALAVASGCSRAPTPAVCHLPPCSHPNALHCARAAKPLRQPKRILLPWISWHKRARSDACKLPLPIFQHAQTPGIWRCFASSPS